MRPVLTSARLASAGLRAQRPMMMRGLPAIANVQREQQLGHLLAATATRGLSLYAPLRSKQDHKPQSHDHQGGNPDLPAFSFNGLGASKGIKNTIIVILGILGTIETWVWCKWIWTWWKGDGEAKEGQASQ